MPFKLREFYKPLAPILLILFLYSAAPLIRKGLPAEVIVRLRDFGFRINFGSRLALGHKYGYVLKSMNRFEWGKLLLAFVLLSTSVSCVLKRRDQPAKPEDEKTEKADTNKTDSTKTIRNVPIKNIPGHLDRQGQMDLETYYNPVNVEAIETEENGREIPRYKRLTGYKKDLQGGVFKDAAYSDASSDLLVDTLRKLKRENNLTKEQKENSIDFAHSIRSAKIIDSKGTLFTIEIQYEESEPKTWNETTKKCEVTKTSEIHAETKGEKSTNNSDKTLISKKLTGLSKSDGRYALLTETNINSGIGSENPTQATPSPSSNKGDKIHSCNIEDEVRAELRCLDLDYKSTCANYFIQVNKMNHDEIIAQAELIVRNNRAKVSEIQVTQASTDLKLSEKSTQLVDLFNGTYDDHYFEDKFIKFYSLTVVEGISEFKVQMETNRGEIISVGGPLLTGIGNAVPLNYPLIKNPNFQIVKERNKNSVTTDLSSLFDAVLLNYNNGRGKIKLTFQNNIPSDDPKKQKPEEVTVSVTSASPPLMKLNKETIFFQPE